MAENKQRNYTAAGFKALQDELDYLKNIKMEEVKKEISTARSFGDLSENSEYDEAKNEQAKTKSRIDELEAMISNAHVVDESEIDESVISVGSIVTVYHAEKGKELTYHLVGSYEADPMKGKISDVSPIGNTLIGAKAGQDIAVEIPSGVIHLHIKSVTRASV